MQSKLNDWKNGWFGLELILQPEEVDQLIAKLNMLKEDPNQHFHLSSDYKAASGLGDIEISVAESRGGCDLFIGSKAFGTDAEVDI